VANLRGFGKPITKSREQIIKEVEICSIYSFHTIWISGQVSLLKNLWNSYWWSFCLVRCDRFEREVHLHYCTSLV